MKNEATKYAVQALALLLDGKQFRFNVKGLVVSPNEFDLTYEFVKTEREFEFKFQPTMDRATSYGPFRGEHLQPVLQKLKEVLGVNAYKHQFEARMTLLEGINEIYCQQAELKVYATEIASFTPNFWQRDDKTKLASIEIVLHSKAVINIHDISNIEQYVRPERGELD